MSATNGASTIQFETSTTNGVGPTERMRITASGSVGIGTTSPSTTAAATTLEVYGNSANSEIRLTTSYSGQGSSAGFSLISDNNSIAYVFNRSNAAMIFGTNNTERMRILANGRVGINTNAPDARLEVQLGNGNVSAGLFYNYTEDVTATLLISRCGTTSGFYHFQAFSTTTTEVFRIESNGNAKNTNNSYGSLSDIKIKDNITDATSKLEDLLKVRIRNYNIIGQDVKQIGVIAQELEEIFPSMVDENEDFEEIKKINEEGNSIIEKKSLGTFTKGVKYSVFVPILIKAIQEQQEMITSLQARLTALENK